MLNLITNDGSQQDGFDPDCHLELVTSSLGIIQAIRNRHISSNDNLPKRGDNQSRMYRQRKTEKEMEKCAIVLTMMLLIKTYKFTLIMYLFDSCFSTFKVKRDTYFSCPSIYPIRKRSSLKCWKSSLKGMCGGQFG